MARPEELFLITLEAPEPTTAELLRREDDESEAKALEALCETLQASGLINAGGCSIRSINGGVDLRLHKVNLCAQLYYSGKACTGGPEGANRRDLRTILEAAGFSVRC